MSMTENEKYVASGANISGDGLYRYSLWREWRGTHDPKHWRWLAKDGAGEPMGEPRSVLFVMLNPSTAGGLTDDPTIRRCVGFAKTWRYERLCVVNLFAYRATKPSDLFAFHRAGGDPIGWNNSAAIITEAMKADRIVCAWGAQAKGWNHHCETVRGWMAGKPHYALGFTKDGSPRHPLSAPANSPLLPMLD
jgi:hypothetical protein